MFYRLKQLIQLVGDIVALYAGLYLGILVRHLELPGQSLGNLISSFTVPFIFALVILFVVGLYDVGRARNTMAFFQKITISASVWFILSIVYFYTSPGLGVAPKTTLLLVAIFGFGLIAIWRSIYNKFLSKNILRVPIAFVGFNDEIKEILEVLLKFPEHGYSVAGVISNSEMSHPIPRACSLDELVKINGGVYPSIIVIAENTVNDQKMLSELYGALYRQASIINLADFYESFFKRIPPFTFSESWFISNLKEQTRKMYDRFKLLIDFGVAVFMGIFFLITLPLIALLIKLNSKGPLFFKQTRVGRLGKVFTIYKYRTMKALGDGGSAEVQGPEFAKVNDVRITGVGKFLRRTRLDEIPQFLNILRGEMAIIGPRPERPEFVDELNAKMPFYSLRHLVKPGIAGWAQLQHSYYGTIEENLVKLQYDLYYVKNRSLFLDIAILLRTINVLVRFMGR